MRLSLRQLFYEALVMGDAQPVRVHHHITGCPSWRAREINRAACGCKVGSPQQRIALNPVCPRSDQAVEHEVDLPLVVNQ